MTAFAIPLALAIVALGAYNEARFDDPFDAGYAHMKVDADLEARIRAKGYFGLGHVPRNAATALAWLLFDERLGWNGLVGAALLLGGILLLYRGERPARVAEVRRMKEEV